MERGDFPVLSLNKISKAKIENKKPGNLMPGLNLNQVNKSTLMVW
jgi:hypothetical protein